jgi:hypothetical protein
MKLLFIKTFIFLLAFTYSAKAQPVVKDYNKLVDQFFSLYSSGKLAEAVDYIYSTNPWMKQKTDSITKVKSTILGLSAMAGEYQEYEILTHEIVDSRYVHMDVAVYYDRQPFRFFFQFYRTKNGWITNSFGLQDDLDDWITEKAKNKFLYFRGY